MKRVIKESMKSLLVKYLSEFSREKDPDARQIECYANNFVTEFERYLAAYNEFKED